MQISIQVAPFDIWITQVYQIDLGEVLFRCQNYTTAQYLISTYIYPDCSLESNKTLLYYSTL